jgi:hypothetical protein
MGHFPSFEELVDEILEELETSLEFRIETDN